MNNYHVYDEIGRGKHSVVYKGRRKKTLQYVAIKSVDKGFRAKTLNEVSILHTLDNPSIIKFHHWYETKNHLWVIVEYCTGGDIHALLLQDKKLPESSVSSFAQHIIRGLFYLHSNGILYCDLKPSNLLLAGNGIIKLCDFGLAQRIVDISAEKQASGKRGTPYYMAPELFQPEGVHSYASDFWALGCVLYELAVGRPPFTSASFTELMRLIFDAPVPRVEGFSTDFTDLLNGLLDKDPSKRLTWNELVQHPWIQSFHLPNVTMPPQPAFDMYLANNAAAADRSSGSDLNSSLEDDPVQPSPDEQSPVPSTPSPRDVGRGQREKGSSTSPTADTPTSNSTTRTTTTSGTPTRSTTRTTSSSSSKRPPTGHVVATPPRGAKVVDVTRLSINAQRNQGENQADLDPYHRSSVDDNSKISGSTSNANGVAGGRGGGGGGGGLILRNFDEELDFSEGGPQEHASKTPSSHRPGMSGQTGGRSGQGDGDRPRSGMGDAIQSDDDDDDDDDSDDDDDDDHGLLPTDAVPARARPYTAPSRPTGGAGAGTGAGGKSGGLARPSSAASRASNSSSVSAVVARRPRTAAPGQTYQKEGSLDALMSTPLPSVPFDSILFHASDLTVMPIVPSKKRGASKTTTPFNASKLPFEPLALSEVLQMESSDLEAFLTRVYRALASHSAVAEKTNILSYFETLCNDQRSADLLVNSSLMTLLVKMLRAYKSTSLKVHLAKVMGMLIRHATYIAEDIGASSKIIEVLCTLLREQGNTVRRHVLACLGELLFYIATQQLEADNASTGGSNASSGSGGGAGWDVQASVFAQITQCLRPEEDTIVQYYAAKTIENISSHSADYARKFAAQDAVALLFKVFQGAKEDSLRLVAITGLGRVLKQQRSLVANVTDSIGIATLLKALSDPNAKIQQALLNVFNMAIMDASAGTRRSFQAGTIEPISNLTKLLEHSSIIVRAKALLAIWLLSRVHLRYLLMACDRKLLPLAERIARHSETYPRQCLQSLMGGIVKIVPSLLSGFTAELARVRSGQFKDVTGPHLPLLLHLMTNSTLRPRIVSAPLVIEFASWLPKVEALSYPNQPESMRIVLLCTEAISQNPPILLQHRESVVRHLLPALTQLLLCANEDTRFLCLKMLAEALILYVSTPDIYDCTEASPLTKASTQAINEVLVQHLLPVIPTVLRDEDPIPVYGLKLLNSVVEANSALIPVLQRLDVIPMLFAAFELEHGHNNIHLIRLISRIVGCNSVEKSYLYDLGLIGKVDAVLAYATENNVESFVDPVLDIVYRILYFTVEAVRGHSDRPATALGQDFVRANEPLLTNLELYIQLLGHTDVAIGENASRSLYLFAQLYRGYHKVIISPLNLEYVAQILDTEGTSPLLARRILKTLQCIASQGDGGNAWKSNKTLDHALDALSRSPEQSVATAARDLRNLTGSL